MADNESVAKQSVGLRVAKSLNLFVLILKIASLHSQQQSLYFFKKP